MRYLVKLAIARSVSELVVVNADSGEVLAVQPYPNTIPESVVFTKRNQLCERLSEEADKVTSRVYDYRS